MQTGKGTWIGLPVQNYAGALILVEFRITSSRDTIEYITRSSQLPAPIVVGYCYTQTEDQRYSLFSIYLRTIMRQIIAE
jgi:hypothetical protein